VVLGHGHVLAHVGEFYDFERQAEGKRREIAQSWMKNYAIKQDVRGRRKNGNKQKHKVGTVLAYVNDKTEKERTSRR